MPALGLPLHTGFLSGCRERGYFLLRYTGFSLQRFLLLWLIKSLECGFRWFWPTGLAALLASRIIPSQERNFQPPALQGRFLTLDYPEKPLTDFSTSSVLKAQPWC